MNAASKRTDNGVEGSRERECATLADTPGAYAADQMKHARTEKPSHSDGPDLWSLPAMTVGGSLDPADGPMGPGLDVDRASDERRWRAQAVISPIEQIVHALASVQIREEDYDARRLAHHVVDLAVRSMGFAQETTTDEVLDELAAMARAMRPDAPSDEWRDIAARVFGGLQNVSHDYDKFRFTGIAADGVRREFSFRLIELREHGDDAVVEATSEAINLFVSALDIEPSNAERAYQALLARQLEEGHLEQAIRTAQIAGRASIASAALINDAIERAQRDVDPDVWVSVIEPELNESQGRVRSRIADDDLIYEKARDLTDADDPKVRAEAGAVGEIVREQRRIHVALERRLVVARPAFLDAQRSQRLAVRRRLRLLSVDTGLFRSVIELAKPDALAVTDVFADQALGVVMPHLMRLDTLIDALLEPVVARERRSVDLEVVGDVDERCDPQRFAPVSLAAAAAVLATAREAPLRLSELLTRARSAGDPDVIVLVRLASLFAFAPERSDDPDEDETRPDDLVAGLAALHDGAILRDDGYAGADLLVGSAEAIEALPAPAKPERKALEPISLAVFRSRR